MKKSLITSAIAAIAITVTSCGGNSSPTASATDSTATATDSVAAIAQLTTPDLTFAEVKGNVKTVANTDPQYGESHIFEFDAEGNLIKCSTYENAKYKRDSEGQIIAIDVYDEEFAYIWENARPSVNTINEPDGTTLTYQFEYDSNGALIKTTGTSDGPDGVSTWTETYTYGPDSFDDHGNWISRTVYNSDINQTVTATRKITYY